MTPVFPQLPGKLVATFLEPAILVLDPIGPAAGQTTNNSGPNEVAIILLILLTLLVYGAPTFFAFYRKHPNRWPILLINVIFGSTIIGWFGALIWALSAVHRSPTGNHGGESGLNLFVNDPQRPMLLDPPLASNTDAASQLQSLKTLLDTGAISADEYAQLKRSLLDRL